MSNQNAPQTRKFPLDVPLLKLTLLQFGTFWPYYIFATIALAGTHWIQSTLPFYAKELADLAQAQVTTGVKTEIPLLPFALAAVGIIVFRTASRLLFFYPARVMERDIRVQVLELLENTPPSRFNRQSPGQLFQTLFADTEQIRALIGFAVLQMGNILMALLILVPKIVAFHPKLLLALTPMMVSFCLFTLVVGKTRHWFRKTQDQQGEVQNFIIEAYNGKSTIKNFQAEKSFLKLFTESSARELHAFYKAGVGTSFSVPLIPLGVGLSMVWGGWVIGHYDLGATSLILFSGFIFLFLEPMMFVSWIGVVFTSSWASWQRIRELNALLHRPSESELELRQLNSSMRSDKSGHSTLNVRFWEKSLELEIPHGNWTVFVGKTGHGKTEVLKQLATLLKGQEERISYLAQAPYLYNDSVLRNIFLGDTPTPERRRLALELSELLGLQTLIDGRGLKEHADEFFSMEVGENGKKLSGGQAKRLCLVRSLMGEAEYLLWDDPFSAVDVLLEKQIVDHLRKLPLLRGKTVILTSHRLTTVRYCDHVIYIDKERGIVEEGRSQEVLLPKRHTYEYFQQQMV